MPGGYIGIDLGTKYWTVGVCESRNIENVPDEHSSIEHPSYVSFTDVVHIGYTAKTPWYADQSNTIYPVKQFLGKTFNELPKLNRDMWPFVVLDVGGKPQFEVEFNGTTRQFSPEEITAMIFSKMKEIAKDYLEDHVEGAVFTVPAHFRDSQKQAIKDAAAIADLNVFAIINEQTAAAICYGAHNVEAVVDKNSKILVFDLGAGSLDVSIISIEDQVFEVKATASDPEVGGEVFVDILLKFFIKEFEAKENTILVDIVAIRRLREASERAIIELRKSLVSRIQLKEFFVGRDLNTSIHISKFEEICHNKFRATLVPIRKALEDSNIEKYQIDQIVLVGGSSLIIGIENILKIFFDGRPLNTSIQNCTDAVSYGAAVHAAMLNGVEPLIYFKPVIREQTTIAFGASCHKTTVHNVIRRNITIPITSSHALETHEDYQTSLVVKIFEEANYLSPYPKAVGNFTLHGINPKPMGQNQININFNVDANGMMDLSAVQFVSAYVKHIRITNDKGISEAQIQFMKEDIDQICEGPRRKRINSRGMKRLQNLCYSRLTKMAEAVLYQKLTQDKFDVLKQIVYATQDWISANPDAGCSQSREQLLIVDAAMRIEISR